MSSWRPQTDLEEEIVSTQPDHHFIYGSLTDQQKASHNSYQPRPAEHLQFLEKKTKKDYENNNKNLPQNNLHVIREINKMVGANPIDSNTAKFEDWDTRENVERETVAMLRHFGMEPSLDYSFNEKATIPTLPVPKNIHVVHNGPKKFPVIFDDNFFLVTTTRSKSANFRKQLNSNCNKDDLDSIVELITTPKDDEEKENNTKTDLEEQIYKKQKNFLNSYPSLESTRHNLTQNVRKTYTSSLTYNSSYSSTSVFESIGDIESSMSSLYLTPNVSTDQIPLIGQKKSSYSNIVREKNNSNIKRNKKFYKPKEVYDLKRHVVK